MTVDNSSVARTADTPFDNADADANIVLRTSDGVDFYIYKVILSLASPFFKSMFSLKQPTSPSSAPSSLEGLPIIDVQESSRTLDLLLRLCYPITDPVIQSMEDIGDVLEAAMKYDMDQPKKLMKALFRDSSTEQPLQAFVVACRLNMEDEAINAAGTWRLNMPFVPELPVGRSGPVDWSRTVSGQSYIEPMAQISAGAYYRLLRYLRTNDVHKFCEPDGDGTELSSPLAEAKPTPLPTCSDQPADIVIKSLDGVDFPAHNFIVCFASSVLANGTILPPSSKALPVHQVDEHSAVLDLAIQLSYPIEDPIITDPEVAIHLLRFATKYRANRAKDFVRRILPSLDNLHPLRMFFIAAQQGWEAEARSAVLRLIHSSVDIYVPEMEQVPASVYRAFLKHHYECFRRVADIAYRDSGTTSFLPKKSPPARPVEGYARVAPAIYSPTVNHAISILRSNPFHIAYDFEAMRNDSERILDEIQTALSLVCALPSLVRARRWLICL